MCLSIPGKIVKIENETATIDYGGEKRTASLLSDEFRLGDYVIVMGKVVVHKIPEKQAFDALKFYREAVDKG